LALLRVREPKPKPFASHWQKEFAAGIAHVARTAQLRQVVLAGVISTSVFGFAESIMYALAGTGLHKSANFVGVLVAVQGAGAIIGGPTAAPLIRRLGGRRVMSFALLTAATGALLELPPLLPPVIAGLALLGMAIPWVVVALISLAQRLTPNELQGRVFSAVDTLTTAPQTASIALGAALIAATGYQPLLVAMAAGMSAAAAYLFTRPEQRRDPVAGETTASKTRLPQTEPFASPDADHLPTLDVRSDPSSPLRRSITSP
jgi:MFS family permease